LLPAWELPLQITRRLLSSRGNFSRVTEKGPLRLCCRGEWDHPSSGKNRGKLRTNQPQLTSAQDDGRKRKFRVPRFVAGNQAVFRRKPLAKLNPNECRVQINDTCCRVKAFYSLLVRFFMPNSPSQIHSGAKLQTRMTRGHVVLVMTTREKSNS
jgi:hypothetical protein